MFDLDKVVENTPSITDKKVTLEHFLNLEMEGMSFPKGAKVFSSVGGDWLKLMDKLIEAKRSDVLVVKAYSINFVKSAPVVDDAELDALLNNNVVDAPLLEATKEDKDPAIGYVNIVVSCPQAFEEGDSVYFKANMELPKSMGSGKYRATLSRLLAMSKLEELPDVKVSSIVRNSKPVTTLKALDFLGE